MSSVKHSTKKPKEVHILIDSNENGYVVHSSPYHTQHAGHQCKAHVATDINQLTSLIAALCAEEKK